MNEPIKYQVIEKDGEPEFAVVPYQQFMALLADKDADILIPNEVVKKNALEGKSMIRAWREHLGINQTEMARRLGLSQPRYLSIEKPDTSLRKETLANVAAALGIDVNQITD